MIITIDGLSGTGKSTVARQLAKALGFVYFDTGAMYRAFTWKILKEKIDFENPASLEKALQDFSFEIKDEKDCRIYLVNGEDVTQEIRLPEVSKFASQVAAIKQVRFHLVEIQREFSHGQEAVFEGRDMGTVVFPDANLKIFLTAKAEIRAERRFKELKEKFPSQKISLEKILEEMEKRDQRDSTRKVSPLKKASDAYEIETSNLTVSEVVEEILKLKKKSVCV